MSDSFSKGIDFAGRAFLKAVEKGVTQGALALARDAVMEEAKVPHDEGTLQGSISVHVEGKCIATAADLGVSENGDPMTGPTEKQRGAITASVGLNSPYAAFQELGMRHDGTHKVVNYSEIGSGPHALGGKMAADPDKYFRGVRKQTERCIRGKGSV